MARSRPTWGIPAAIRHLARSEPSTYLPAGPFISGGPQDNLYVLDPSVLALVSVGRARA